MKKNNKKKKKKNKKLQLKCVAHKCSTRSRSAIGTKIINLRIKINSEQA